MSTKQNRTNWVNQVDGKTMERIMKEALQYKPKNGETREDQKEMD
jgi:hypothetical protein